MLNVIHHHLSLAKKYSCNAISFTKMKLGKKVVRIDGGLGNQIIKYAIFSQSQKMFSKVYLDDRYFRNCQVASNSYVYRNWELNRFGITLFNESDLKTTYCLSDKAFVKLFKPAIEAIFSDLDQLKSLFPLPYDVEELILREIGIPIAIIQRSIVLHIRQGDYLEVASKLMRDIDYAELLEKVLRNSIIRKHSHVIVFSDSKVNRELFPLLYNVADRHKSKIIVFDEVDDWASHCAMRLSGILICSNSTFSFSAAILRRELSIYPKEFYLDGSRPLNEMFLEASKFMIR